MPRSQARTIRSTAFFVGRESAPTFVDLDGDGDLDMIVGEQNGALKVFDNNNGDTGFSERKGTDNPLNGIDVGFFSAPSFVDLDGDGDLDMVVGERYGTLFVFDNNDADAGFSELTGADNPLNDIDVGDSSVPTFVDLDGDGDLDMVVGETDGTLFVFDNNGAGFSELTGTDNPFNGIDVVNYSKPTFVDLDDDGDLDMVVGANSGTLVSFENTTPRGEIITVTVTAENDGVTRTGTSGNNTLIGTSELDVYSAHSKTRRFCSEMMRKLSVT